jgi:hypothetical protein
MRRALAFFVAVSLLAVASCGSRTGLFGPAGDGALADGGLPDGRATGPDGTVPCVPGRFDLELATAQIMFVIDRSGSMQFELGRDRPADPGERRWDILRTSLDETFAPFDGELTMGAKFFPEPLTERDVASADRACRTETGVSVAPSRGNLESVLSVFDRTEPRGGTPTAEAVRLAAEFLVQSRTVARTLVLATDGAPNCNVNLDASSCVCTTPDVSCAGNPDRGRYSCLDDDRTVATIRDIAEGQNIPVFVIGIGSLGRPAFLEVLDQMAIAGGRPRAESPRHYNVQTAGEMTSALATIRDSVSKCTYLTPSSPIDPDEISVEVDGAPIDRDSTRQNGWDWVDQAYGELAFFGAACERVRTGAARVTGVVTCESK